MGAYEDIKRDDLTLRDTLALDRTVLAYERTALGYARTAVASFVAGITLIQLSADTTLIGVGVALIVGGSLSSMWGLWRVRRRTRRLRHLSV
jgi:putative membrane protein